MLVFVIIVLINVTILNAFSYNNAKSFQHISLIKRQVSYVKGEFRLKMNTERIRNVKNGPFRFNDVGHTIINKIKKLSIWRPFEKMNSFIQNELPMLKYVWPHDNIRLRIYLVLSMVFMFLGKYYNVQVPFVLQKAIDAASKTAGLGADKSLTAATAGMVMFYGVSRALSVIFSEIKTCLFASVSQNVLRKFAGQIFSHLHSLDSEFHWQTASGTISVAYVRAIRGFQTMLFQIVFSVAPALLELIMVANVLYRRCGGVFAGITLGTFLAYTLFTVWITEWRVLLRRELVDVDNTRNGFFIDSILNHEVVKLFTNEKRELARFDSYLQRIEDLNVQSTYSIAVLNLGQASLFCLGLTSSLLLALQRVALGTMSVGDLVAVNGLLLQLSIPFNFIGYTYQELRQAYVDMGYMRNILTDQVSSISQATGAPRIDEVAPILGPSSLEFRDLLKGVSFKINPGESAAIVGPSGSGKSTTLRLITRMLAPVSGQVLLDGVDISSVALESVRQRVSVVPQDTSLFDETVEFNLKYGNQSVSAEAMEEAVDLCNLRQTVERLQQGLQTRVGERGAKLSGGERQKVSIARAILRNPSLILCDEVTSSVDAFAERDIVNTLRQASQRRTTLTVAHRLSSITHCDRIIVIDHGRVVEQGTHQELLTLPDGLYRRMWEAQNERKPSSSMVMSSSISLLDVLAVSKETDSNNNNNSNNNNGDYSSILYPILQQTRKRRNVTPGVGSVSSLWATETDDTDGVDKTNTAAGPRTTGLAIEPIATTNATASSAVRFFPDRWDAKS
eukprot:gene10862-22680_t